MKQQTNSSNQEELREDGLPASNTSQVDSVEGDRSPGEHLHNVTAQLEQARREASEAQDRYLRVHAEMENYKKRIERTYADLARNSKKEVLLKLLAVKDNLERALNYGESSRPGDEESVMQGVRLTEYQLDQLLRSEGVTPMDLQGKQFTPEEAEAVSTVVDAEADDHSVAQVVQQGYTYQDQVLRPAKVVVALRRQGEEI